VKTAPAPDDQDRRDEDNRIWSHGMHINDSIIQRGNYFLVAQSMLIVAYSLLLSSGRQSSDLSLVAKVIGSLGVLLSAMWGYVSWSGTKYLRHVQRIAFVRLPEYRLTRETWASTRVPATIIFTYLVPSVVGVMWLLLFVVV
jgi:hypothetical protein